MIQPFAEQLSYMNVHTYKVYLKKKKNTYTDE